MNACSDGNTLLAYQEQVLQVETKTARHLSAHLSLVWEEGMSNQVTQTFTYSSFSPFSKVILSGIFQWEIHITHCVLSDPQSIQWFQDTLYCWYHAWVANTGNTSSCLDAGGQATVQGVHNKLGILWRHLADCMYPGHLLSKCALKTLEGLQWTAAQIYKAGTF